MKGQAHKQVEVICELCGTSCMRNSRRKAKCFSCKLLGKKFYYAKLDKITLPKSKYVKKTQEPSLPVAKYLTYEKGSTYMNKKSFLRLVKEAKVKWGLDTI